MRNVGDTDGDEIVQLYIKDDISSVTTYEKQLRGFDRIRLKAGETKRVCFHLKGSDFALWNRYNEFVVEPGTFTIMIGASSEDIRLTEKVEIM